MSILTTVLLILLFIALLLLLLTIIVLTIFQIYSRAISDVPLVPVRKNALETIVNTLNLKAGDVFYDLGSGDGRVLEAVILREPEANVTGFEIGPWPRLESKLRLRKYGKKVKVLNQDFFKADLSNATHIYMYLFPAILEKLEPRFNQMLRSGTKVVSCDFQFKNKVPDQVITVPNSKILSKNIYVYIW